MKWLSREGRLGVRLTYETACEAVSEKGDRFEPVNPIVHFGDDLLRDRVACGCGWAAAVV